MAFGIATWDANGRYNNYGIKPVTVIGTIQLALDQTSGTYYYPVPAGFKVGYLVAMADASSEPRYGPGRTITASGNAIIIGPVTGDTANLYPATAGQLIIFLEKA